MNFGYSPASEGLGGLVRPAIRSRHVNKFAALFAAVVVSIAGIAVAADAPDSIVLPAKPGNVTFPHKAHATNLKCVSCHKDAKGGDIEGLGKDVNKDKAHALCQECHKKEAKGPTKCAECHKKA